MIIRRGREIFGVRTSLDETPERSVNDLGTAGLVVERADEWLDAVVFRDVGAVAYALNALPWEVPGFSIRRHEAELRSLQARLERDGDLRFRAGRFLIAATKRTSPEDE